jgi:hypothetical protein
MCILLLKHNGDVSPEHFKYSRAPVSTDSVSAVSFTHGSQRPEKKSLKIKEINGS